MWDFLAYFSLLLAVAYIVFVLWAILRGSFDQDEDRE
jgi:cbb3-type cytochrome oxidase subunit 3